MGALMDAAENVDEVGLSRGVEEGEENVGGCCNDGLYFKSKRDC
jgi:hypothetical protein